MTTWRAKAKKAGATERNECDCAKSPTNIINPVAAAALLGTGGPEHRGAEDGLARGQGGGKATGVPEVLPAALATGEGALMSAY